MAYIGVSPSNGVRKKHTYTATASQTSFSGAGDEGITLAYRDSNYVDVYQNGVKLADEDYTATSGTAIVLAQGASADDIVEIIAFDVFSVADTVSKADGGTFDGNVTMAGTLGVTGVLTGTSLDISGDIDVDGITNLDVVDIDGTLNVAGETTLQTHLNMGDGDIIKFGESADLQISHTGGYSKIADSGTGNLVIACQNFQLTNPDVGENMIFATVDGAVDLYYDSNKKFETTSTGVTVTGTVTSTGTSVFASLDISGDIDVDGTTNLDVVDIDGAVDMASTLAVAGVVTANAGVVVDNITIDGTEIDLSSGDLTLDVAGDIILDADGGEY
jgi:cytoskeletal protein CcmA (bactofilin family)